MNRGLAESSFKRPLPLFAWDLKIMSVDAFLALCQRMNTFKQNMFFLCGKHQLISLKLDTVSHKILINKKNNGMLQDLPNILN